MNFIDLPLAKGVPHARVSINTAKILALYDNGKPDEQGNFPWTFVELGPDGLQDATGAIVALPRNKVEKLLANY